MKKILIILMVISISLFILAGDEEKEHNCTDCPQSKTEIAPKPEKTQTVEVEVEEIMDIADDNANNEKQIKIKILKDGEMLDEEEISDIMNIKMLKDKDMGIEMMPMMIEKFKMEPTPISLNRPDNYAKLYLNYESGFIGVLIHALQLGVNGSKFDYVNEGNQNNLYPFSRLSADVVLGDRHTITLLYQPLNIVTEARLERDIIVDSIVFPQYTAMDFRYSFDFYRLSYTYDLLPCADKELSVGVSFQIRNAFISFKSKDGNLITTNEDIGPVPIFKVRGKMPIADKFWAGIEADGFYASGRYITGTGNDFVGSIFDVSGRIGYDINSFADAYLNARYVGGGANGTDETYEGTGDGYTDNWLHTFSLSLGLRLK